MLKVLFPWKQNNTKKVLSSMEQQVVKEVTEVTEEPPENLPLLPCHVCNRTFLPQPLKKHIRICEQMAHKKRKPFDSLKQRIEGTDLAPFFQKSYIKKNNPDMNSHAPISVVYGNRKQSKWKEKHLELVKTIRTAKGASPEMSSLSSSATATPNKKPNYLAVSQTSLNERCPSCDRAFGPKAFDRHVEWCRERQTVVHKSPANVQQAKERLDARIKYRVPPLKQPKRLTVRAKYSPTSQSNISFHRSNSMLTGKSTTSLGCSSKANIITTRRKIINNSEKEKETNQGSRQHDSRSRFDKGIGDCVEVKESEKCESSVCKSFHTKRTIPIKKINNSSINNGFQEITVSSLCIAKNKKLLTWKETPKIPSTKLEVISSDTKRSRMEKLQSNIDLNTKNSKGTQDGEKRTSVKVVTSTVLREKLNSFYKKKQLGDPKIPENKMLLLRVSDEINMDSGDKGDINRSQSIEKASDLNKLYGKSSSVTVNTSDFEYDIESLQCQLNDDLNQESERMVGSDVESILSLHGSANTVTYTYDDNENKNIVVVVQDDKSNIIRKNESDKQPYMNINKKFTDELTADRTESVNNAVNGRLLTGPLKEEARITNTTPQHIGMSSIENSDIPSEGYINLNLKRELLFKPDSKNVTSNIDLINRDSLNDKELYQTMNMHRLKKTEEREELQLLERNRIFLSVSEESGRDSRETLLPQSESSANIIVGENEILDKRNVKEWKTKVCETISSVKQDEDEKLQEINIDDNRSLIFNKRTLCKQTSRKSKCWARRQKMKKKCRMCIKCFLRNVRSRRILRFKSNVHSKAHYCDSLNSAEDIIESLERSYVDDNSLSLCSETKVTRNTELSTIPTAINITLRRSKSANEIVGENSENVIRSEQSDNMNKSSRIYDETSRSLPNISIIRSSASEITEEEWIEENKKLSLLNAKLIAEESVDSVVPRKRRKISGSPPTAVSKNKIAFEIEVQNLKTNINKIKNRKLGEDEPPVILDYEKIASTHEPQADILYINRVFSCLISPERSELESGNEQQVDDDIQNIANDEMENWDADEQIPRDSECDSLSKRPLALGEIRSGAEVSRGQSANCTQYSLFPIEQKINKAFKNSSICSDVIKLENVIDESSYLKDFKEGEIFLANTARRLLDITAEPKISDDIFKGLKNDHCCTLSCEINSKDVNNLICRLPKLATLEKQNLQIISNDTSKTNIKLPVIYERNSKLFNKTTFVNESQVDESSHYPSSNLKPEKVSIYQQTSRQDMKIDPFSVHRKEFHSNCHDGYLRKELSSPTTAPYDPFELAQRQFMELLDHDEKVSVRSSPLILTTPHNSDNSKTQNIRPHTSLNAIPQRNVKRASVIDPPYNFQDKICSLDEDFELIESVVNSNILTELTQSRDDFFPNSENFESTGDENSNLPQLKVDYMSSIDPNLINEHDNLSIPENLRADEYSPSFSIDSELTIHNFNQFINFFDDPTRYTGFGYTPTESKTLSEFIQPSIKSYNIRPAPDGSSGEAEMTGNRQNLKSAASLRKLGRTDNKFKIGSSGGSTKMKNIKMPTVTESDKSASAKNKDIKIFGKVKEDLQENSLKVDSDENGKMLQAEDLFAVDDKLYEEYKKYEETYLKEKSRKYNTKKQKNRTADFGIILEDRITPLSGDSAYGSLNRKQPKGAEVSPVLQESKERLQSSFPGEKMSKFCHECGHKYPVTSAKFCVECGVKRLVL